MSEVIIYSKKHCPYCIRAKRFFDERSIKYTEHMMDEKLDELNKLKEKTGHMTVPQIFINGTFIGGFSDLVEAEKQGKINALLNKTQSP